MTLGIMFRERRTLISSNAYAFFIKYTDFQTMGSTQDGVQSGDELIHDLARDFYRTSLSNESSSWTTSSPAIVSPARYKSFADLT